MKCHVASHSIRHQEHFPALGPQLRRTAWWQEISRPPRWCYVPLRPERSRDIVCQRVESTAQAGKIRLGNSSLAAHHIGVDIGPYSHVRGGPGQDRGNPTPRDHRLSLRGGHGRKGVFSRFTTAHEDQDSEPGECKNPLQLHWIKRVHISCTADEPTGSSNSYTPSLAWRTCNCTMFLRASHSGIAPNTPKLQSMSRQ